MNTNRELFEEAPVSRAVATMAVPTMISMLVVVIYNMADTFFIGQTGDPLQVAAVSLATPVFMMLMALGNLFGIGGSSAISRALGEKHMERAKNFSSFCCYASLGLGVIVAGISLVFMGGILKLIGASANTMEYAGIRQYSAGRGCSQRIHDWKFDRNSGKYCSGSHYDSDVWLGCVGSCPGDGHWKYGGQPVLSDAFFKEEIQSVHSSQGFPDGKPHCFRSGFHWNSGIFK